MSARAFAAPDDGFVIFDQPPFTGYKDTEGRLQRPLDIDPSIKTLILISAGQSTWCSSAPSLYMPAHPTRNDNFNIYDGMAYEIKGPMLGCSDNTTVPFMGPGHVSARIGDILISKKLFGRVIHVPVAINGSSIVQWATPNQFYYDRIGIAMRRLAANGITPFASGVTFALIWGQGYSDRTMSREEYVAHFERLKAKTIASGFAGKIYVTRETRRNDLINADVRAAQAAVVDNVLVFSGGDHDRLGSTYRVADGTHFADAGDAARAKIVSRAIIASLQPLSQWAQRIKTRRV